MKRIIYISKKDVERLKDLSRRIETAKAENGHYVRDGRNLGERFLIGLIAERCIEKWSGLEIIEWSAEVLGAKYEHPDIKELNIGIKAFKPGHFPLIYRNNEYPQIMVEIHLTEKDCYGIILGVASVDVLNEYQSDDRVMDKNALRCKTAFVGLNNLEDITHYVKAKENKGSAD